MAETGVPRDVDGVEIVTPDEIESPSPPGGRSQEIFRYDRGSRASSNVGPAPRYDRGSRAPSSVGSTPRYDRGSRAPSSAGSAPRYDRASRASSNAGTPPDLSADQYSRYPQDFQDSQDRGAGHSLHPYTPTRRRGHLLEEFLGPDGRFLTVDTVCTETLPGYHPYDHPNDLESGPGTPRQGTFPTTHPEPTSRRREHSAPSARISNTGRESASRFHQYDDCDSDDVSSGPGTPRQGDFQPSRQEPLDDRPTIAARNRKKNQQSCFVRYPASYQKADKTSLQPPRAEKPDIILVRPSKSKHRSSQHERGSSSQKHSSLKSSQTIESPTPSVKSRSSSSRSIFSLKGESTSPKSTPLCTPWPKQKHGSTSRYYEVRHRPRG